MEDKNSNGNDVLDIFVKLGDMYINMLMELETQLDSLGGVLEDFSPMDGIINIKVAPEFEQEISNFVKDLINKYNEERALILKSDPFIGIKALLSTEEGN